MYKSLADPVYGTAATAGLAYLGRHHVLRCCIFRQIPSSRVWIMGYSRYLGRGTEAIGELV